MSVERKIAVRGLREHAYNTARKIGQVFNRVDPDHESDKLCPRCIREHKRILMGIKQHPRTQKGLNAEDASKTIYVCGTCHLQISEILGQSPMTGALNPDDVVSLINSPNGAPKIIPSELSGYDKRHPTSPDDPNDVDNRYLKDIVRDLEQNHIANLHGNKRYVFRRRSTMASDIHNNIS